MKITKNKDLLLIPVFTIIFLLANMYRKYVFGDELWNFAFSFNLANGYIPYKDFNMIVTPLYSILAAAVMKIIGNNYLSYMIFNSFIGSLVVYFSKINKERFLVVVFIILVSFPITYNTLILLFYYLLIMYDDNDMISGLLVSMIFLTKHSVGVLFFLVMIIFSKNRLKRLIYFLIPVFIFIIYLLVTDSLRDFIDLGVLGLFDFGSKNRSIKLSYFFIYLFFVGFVVYKCIKTKFKDKNLIYLLALQGIAVPIFDMYHILIATTPIWNHFCKKVNTLLLNAFTITVIIISFFYIVEFDNVPNNSKYFKYRNYSTTNPYGDMVDYLKGRDNLVFVTSYAPILKIELELKPERFDLPLNGNLGYHGTEKFIEFIDKKCVEDCYIVLGNDNWQMDEKVIKHVKEKYKLVDIKIPFRFYTSKK